MNIRQVQILQYVVESHVETGEPVSSSRLVKDFDLQVSPATVRNDLCALEEAGYLRAPHTSAGRVPTEAGYRFYVDHMRDVQAVAEREVRQLALAVRQERRVKSIARVLADLTGETVIVARNGNSVYYTGIKNLFGKPEFAEMAHVAAISELLDTIEERLSRMLDRVTRDVTVHIGSEGQFGAQYSTISMKLSPQATYILLGPMRMQYGRNMALLRNVQQLLL